MIDRQSGKQTFRVRTGPSGRKLERMLCVRRYSDSGKFKEKGDK